MSEIKPTPQAELDPSNLQQLVTLFKKALPLIINLTIKLRWAMIIGVGALMWIGVWLLAIKGFSWVSTLIVLVIGAIPVLIIMRFWWSFEELKGLPDILNAMVTDAKSELIETVQEVKAGNIKKMGFLGSAKGLWSVGSMLADARGLLGSYVSIATLVNPFSLFIGVISLLAIGGLVMIGVVLAVLAF